MSFTGPNKENIPHVDHPVVEFVWDAQSKAPPVAMKMLECKVKETTVNLELRVLKH